MKGMIEYAKKQIEFIKKCGIWAWVLLKWTWASSPRVRIWAWEFTKGLIKKYGIWVSIVIFSVFIFCLKPSYDPSGRDYLLSAVSQVLGAIFALVFTITLLVAEISAKYSSKMLEIFFTNWVVVYMFLFILSIVFPLGALMHISDLAVKVSLILCATCLLLLIPYFLSVKKKISPENFLEILLAKGMEKLHKTHKFPEEIKEIKIIDNVVLSSYSFKDYDTFEIGLVKLGQLAIAVEEKMSTSSIIPSTMIQLQVDKFRIEAFRRIREIGSATIEDPHAAYIVTQILMQVGYETLDKKFFHSLNSTIFVLGSLGYISSIKQIKLDGKELADWIGGLIEALGERAASNRMDGSLDAATGLILIGNGAKDKRMKSRIAQRLWSLGASVAKDVPEIIGNMTQLILDFESSVGESYIDEGFENTKKVGTDLEHLEKIRKSYEESKTREQIRKTFV